MNDYTLALIIILFVDLYLLCCLMMNSEYSDDDDLPPVPGIFRANQCHQCTFFTEPEELWGTFNQRCNFCIRETLGFWTDDFLGTLTNEERYLLLRDFENGSITPNPKKRTKASKYFRSVKSK